MKRRILITGGTGLLALNWAYAIEDQFEIYLSLHERRITLPNFNFIDINVERIDSIIEVLVKLKPEIVINTIAVTSIEKCESNEMLAWHTNVFLAHNIAKACLIVGVKLVHISTDHLFNGNVALSDEERATSPVNVYGRTKAEAEEIVLHVDPSALIIRTNFFGWAPPYRKSLSDFIVHSLRSKKKVFLFQDVYFTPIIIAELVRVTHELVKLGRNGIYNVIGTERLTKYQFGITLAKVFNLSENLVLPCTLVSQKHLCKRPSDMSLSNELVSRLIDEPVLSLTMQLNLLLQQEESIVSRFRKISILYPLR